MKLYALSVIIITLLFLTASCQSTKNLSNTNSPVLTEQALSGTSKDVSPPGYPTRDTNKDEIYASERHFSESPYWATYNFLPSLIAFEESCKQLSVKNENTFIHPEKKELGIYRDWIRACQKLKKIKKSNEEAKNFFETEFKFIQNTQLKNKIGRASCRERV